MNEEEKKAVQDSKNIINELNNHKDKDFIGRMYYKNKPIEEILAILLNLIEKLRERLKLMDDYNNWVQVAIDRGIELEKLQKENEELKEYITIAPNLDEMTAIKYRNIRQDAYIQGRAEEQQRAEQIIYKNYISKQKIKDKIKELERFIYRGKNAPQDFLQYRVKAKIQGYKELLEESEE